MDDCLKLQVKSEITDDMQVYGQDLMFFITFFLK